ncbi:phosphoribosyltransferase [Pseudomonas matsuisoli]|uniref:Phosphoribosyltransferase n=1 Tax=Pseudomonas matsuisoli TaxID=1515666 RepID=A0A917PV97_9PSED|nr:phosphoribosyltransferase family protein [Pseudomonas matsuisoli]GGJ93472.1 phosphoribosyltransferase [Pseudomonas matsuisoli]
MPRYRDRRSAGKLLLDALRPSLQETPVVLALPRGGVPVAFEIAMALNAPLDLLLVRKIGVPGREEFAVGAIAEGDPSYAVADPRTLSFFQLSTEWFEHAKALQLEEIKRRRLAYGGARQWISLTGKTVVIVDDGVATGSTARVALEAAAAARPSRLLFATPVGASSALAKLRPQVDDCICPYIPQPFEAVGQHYDDFEQTTDAEVVALLEQARSRQ